MENLQNESSRAALEYFLYEEPEATRQENIALWANARSKRQKKEDVIYLQERLAEEKDAWRRTWCITALAAINDPTTIGTIAELLDPNKEPFEWARYWAIVGLSKMLLAGNKKAAQREKLKTYLLDRIYNDESPSVRAVALRLLVQDKFQDRCIDPTKLPDSYAPKNETEANQGAVYVDALTVLLSLVSSTDWESRRAACKALRGGSSSANYAPSKQKTAATDSPDFEIWVEKRLVPALAKILHDRFELGEVRYQAAQAIRNIRHKELEPEVIDNLSEALTDRRDLRGMARRVCVDALADHETPEIKEAILFALEDDDAEIRQRAAKALAGEKVLGDEGAIKFIIEHLLLEETEKLASEDEPTRRYSKYIEALREIDSKLAAQVLSEYLLHPDPDRTKRAARALTELGGEAASRTLQAQRAIAVNTYTKLLGEADDRIMQQFESLMRRAQMAFTMSMGMHGIIFFLGIVTLVASIYTALGQGFEGYLRFIGGVGSIGSLGVLVFLFYRDPLKNIRSSVNNLVKVNVVFLGYIRRINQIDATFKQLFFDTAGFDIEKMQSTVAEIEEAVGETLSKIELYLEDNRAGAHPSWQDEDFLKRLAPDLNRDQMGKAIPSPNELPVQAPKTVSNKDT
jgi:HEAT repeat protein